MLLTFWLVGLARATTLRAVLSDDSQVT